MLNRKNLYTTSGITCTKILFNKNKAIGVEYLSQVNSFLSDNIDAHTRNKIYCEGPVIIAGGAINSPQILMLSGLGPANHLRVIIIK